VCGSGCVSDPLFFGVVAKLSESWVQEILDARFDDVELVALEDVGNRQRRIVRLFVDHPQGVTHDLLSQVSAVVGNAFDEAGVPSGPYTLEVSSPGLERPLTKPAHFRAQVGKKVYVKTREPVDGQKVWQGVLEQTDDEQFTVVEGPRRASIRHANVAKAHLVFEFDQE
jgi:ribosome maturation factor RimP